MIAEQQEKFFARAEQLGHSRDVLKKKGTQTTKVTVNSIEEMRKLVRYQDEEQCKLHEAHIDALVGDEDRGFKHHIESYLYGTGQLPPALVKEAQKGFPKTVEIVSLDNKTMAHGETVIGPSGPPTVWNYGTVNFYSDSYLTVKNTYFNMTVQNLVMQYTGS